VEVGGGRGTGGLAYDLGHLFSGPAYVSAGGEGTSSRGTSGFYNVHTCLS